MGRAVGDERSQRNLSGKQLRDSAAGPAETALRSSRSPTGSSTA